MGASIVLHFSYKGDTIHFFHYMNIGTVCLIFWPSQYTIFYDNYFTTQKFDINLK